MALERDGTGAGADQAARIEGLETELSYQARAVAELSELGFEQERRIARLEKLLGQLAEKLKELGGDGPPLPPNERPPHY